MLELAKAKELAKNCRGIGWYAAARIIDDLTLEIRILRTKLAAASNEVQRSEIRGQKSEEPLTSDH